VVYHHARFNIARRRREVVTMSTAILWCIAVGVGFALWVVMRKVDAIPERVGALARDERSRAEERAQTVFQEAAAAKIGPMVAGLRGYHDQLAALAREQRAAAELRARMVERQSSEAGVALSAASELVRELRALLDETAARTRAGAVPEARAGTVDEPVDPGQRPTVELMRPPAPETVEASAVETTRKPPPESRAQRSPRGREAALAAAGLGPRPNARALPPLEKLHAPPEQISAPCKETMIGVAPPAAPPTNEGERLSDEDVTVVAKRAWTGTEQTLLSMPAVKLPSEREKGAS
jgi:hypothetical protein